MSDGDVKKFIIKKTADDYVVYNPTRTYKKMLDDTYFYTIPIMQIIFTSRGYPIIVEEEMELAGVDLTRGVSFPRVDEYVDLGSIDLTSGIFRQALKTYDDGIIEEVELSSIDLTEGLFKCVMITYDDALVEEVELSSVDLTEGEFRVAMINYENYEREEVELNSIDLTEGSHETS